MPELPEIETIKLQLRKVLVGQRNLKYEILNLKSIRNDSITKIANRTVKSIDRKGKVLLIDFGENLKLGFHFKMTGQLIYEEAGKRIVGGHPTEDFINKLPSKHTRAIFYFNKGVLYYNDQRMFGWIDVNPKFIDRLGPEPFDIDESKFISIIGKTKKPIKLAIMDQERIAGVGNIYANDALWESGISPKLPADQLSVTQLSLLCEKLKLVLKEGIKYGGATAANYVDLHGLGGHYQEHFRVYNREGLPCLKCKTSIKKIILGGRGTYFCPKCQGIM